MFTAVPKSPVNVDDTERTVLLFGTKSTPFVWVIAELVILPFAWNIGNVSELTGELEATPPPPEVEVTYPASLFHWEMLVVAKFAGVSPVDVVSTGTPDTEIVPEEFRLVPIV